jgi:putative cell wall-binding protein
LARTELLPATEGVYRIFGDNRYETAFKAAQTLKEIYGIEKFDTIVVASGNEFADALSGSYLAVRHNAPMLLVNPRMVDPVSGYIRDHLQQDGTVYLLGGTAAVPAEMEEALAGLHVIRLAGSNRYETNLAILREAGMDGQELLVCTGKDFADSLSASALGLPILLVNNTLLDSQKAFLRSLGSIDFYIIGGENAVSMELADALVEFGRGARIAGANRYETSVNIASTFAPDCKQMVTAYGHNFPDGLCGGVLAAAINAPLILTRDRNLSYAAEFAAERQIRSGIVLGGSGLINDETVRTIFSMDETRDILLK